MSDLLRGLNDNQRRAVENIEGYTRVIAGPGSGKTKTLTTTYATLIDEIGVPESSILCITFTSEQLPTQIWLRLNLDGASFLKTFKARSPALAHL